MRVFCLFLLLIMAQSIISEKARCITKNIFLEQMKNASPLGVDIFKSPKIEEFDKCEYEWNKFGNCCDVLDLEAFYQLENRLINLNEKYLAKAVNDSMKVFNNIRTGEKRDKLRRKMENFTRDSNTCWNHMKKMRSSAACSICSGRSEVFFKDDKALISPDTCIEAVGACSNFFNKVNGVIHGVQYILNLRRKEAILNNTEIADLEDLESDFETYRPPEELFQAFSMFKKHKHSNSSKEKLMAALDVCSMIVNLRKAPYILIMNEEGIEAFKEISFTTHDKKSKFEVGNGVKELPIQNNNGVFEKINIDTRNRFNEMQKTIKRKVMEDKINSKIAGLRQNWEDTKKSKKRAVQNRKLQLTAEANPFVSDTSVLLNSDNMFTSLDGIKGTTLQTESQTFKPMNLSLIFP